MKKVENGGKSQEPKITFLKPLGDINGKLKAQFLNNFSELRRIRMTCNE